jgi:hypothetical protein
MFIRIKRISGQQYAYLVKSVWTDRGARQKNQKYLGKVVHLGSVPYDIPEVSSSFVSDSIHQLLIAAGFNYDKVYTKDDIQITSDQVTRKDKPCVLAINDGFLCDDTLKNALALEHPKHIQDLINEGKLTTTLAKSLVEAGLLVDEETYISLYELLVPNL